MGEREGRRRGKGRKMQREGEPGEEDWSKRDMYGNGKSRKGWVGRRERNEEKNKTGEN